MELQRCLSIDASKDRTVPVEGSIREIEDGTTPDVRVHHRGFQRANLVKN